jgi:hypothetical protein
MLYVWITLGVLVASLPAFATNYFVDASNGSSNNSGLSADSPYDIATAVGQAQAGDVINVAPGTYNVPVPLDVAPGVTIQGTSGSNRPYFLALFGASNDEARIIDRFDNTGPPDNRSFQIFYDPNRVPDGQEGAYVVNGGYAYNRGIFNVRGAYNNTFRNLELDGNRFNLNPGTDFGASAGIRTFAGSVNSSPDQAGVPPGGNILIDSCVFRNVRGAGVLLFGGNNDHVTNSFFYDCGFAEGSLYTSADASSGALTVENVRNSLFDNNQFFSTILAAGFGIKLGYFYNRNNTVQNNTFSLYGAQPYEGRQDPNFAIEATSDEDSTSLIGNTFNNSISIVANVSSAANRLYVYNNNFTNNSNRYAYGVELGAFNVEFDSNLVSGGNTFIQNFGGDYYDDYFHNNVVDSVNSFISGFDGFYRQRIYNNTVYLNGGSGNNFLNINGSASDLDIRNNIVWANSSGGKFLSTNGSDNVGGNVQINNNIVHNVSLSVNGNVPAVNFDDDPQIYGFGSKPNPFYVLRNGSPAINHGVPVGLPYNGSAPDIGAIEDPDGFEASRDPSPYQGSGSSSGSGSSLIGQVISFKAVDGYFVSSDLNTGDAILDTKYQTNSPGTWEKFTVVDAGNGQIALKAYNGYFVSCDLNNGAILDAKYQTTNIGSWEKFTYQDLGGGNVALLANANGYYVSCDLNNGGVLAAKYQNSFVGTWETFIRQ